MRWFLIDKGRDKNVEKHVLNKFITDFKRPRCFMEKLRRGKTKNFSNRLKKTT